MSYYIRIRGKAFGPFEQTQLVEMKTQGKISRTTEISENRSDWVNAADVDFLFPKPKEVESPKNTPLETTTAHQSVVQRAEPAVWMYSVDGQTGYGPVSATKINELLGSRVLTEKSLIWQEGENARTIKEEPIFSKPIKSHRNDPLTISGDVSLSVLDPLFKSSGWLTFLKVCAVLHLVSLALTGLGCAVFMAVMTRPLGAASATIVAIIVLLGFGGIFYFFLRGVLSLWAYHANISKLMYDRTESGLIDNHTKILAFWKHTVIFLIACPVISIVTTFLCLMFLFALGDPSSLLPL